MSGSSPWRVFLAVLGFYAFGSADGADRPNIVFIFSDDAGYNEFGFSAASTGTSTQFETPHLDALAAQSKVLTQAYVSSPICSPSRAAFMTGQYQNRFGYERNISPGVNSTSGLTGDQVLITERMKSLGYTTGVFGKWHVGLLEGENRPHNQGVDEFYGLLDGSRSYWSGETADGRLIRRGNDSIESVWATEGDASRYDPSRGRYLTDAFGEEAANFIDRHAQDEAPFFLYVPLTGPHLPIDAKFSDLARFAHITDPIQQTLAAMNYAVDRAAGDVLSAIERNGLDDNTIVVFSNDNGGQGSHHINAPFQGRKGYIYEGGIRVPTLIRAPGLTPGEFSAPVTLRDLAPTFVNAGGGDASQIDFDGVDLLPHLQAESEEIHDILYWRHYTGAWAVRQGDLKLTSPAAELDGRYALYNVTTDPGETNDLQFQPQHLDLVNELLVKLGYWEAGLERSKWGGFGSPRHDFDHFTINPSAGGGSDIYWFQGGRWTAPDGTSLTMSREDGYANAILEFVVKNDGNYTTRLSTGRLTKQNYMLNEIRLTGESTSSSQHQANVAGNELLMVENLSGAGPKIALSATSTNPGPQFAFKVYHRIQLMHDLEITGDGDQYFEMRAPINDFDPSSPRSITKTGASSVTFLSPLGIRGELRVLGENVRFNGASAGVNNDRVEVGPGAKITQIDGDLTTRVLEIDPAGTYDLVAGRLAFDQASGDIVNTTALVAVGRSLGLALVDGSYTQRSTGVLEVEIGRSGSDQLIVSEAMSLSGQVEIALLDGFSPTPGSFYSIAMAATLDASSAFLSSEDSLRFELVPFQEEQLFVRVLGGLEGDYNFDGIVDAGDYALWRDSLGASTPRFAGADGNGDGEIGVEDYTIWRASYGNSHLSALEGDYNRDGIVDAGDYALWRDSLGASTPRFAGADGNGDGEIGVEDYTIWRASYGNSHLSAQSETTTPEPSSAILGLLAMWLVPIWWTRN